MIVSDLTFREATAADVPAIVAMLADDALGATREDLSDLAPYFAAFERMSSVPGHHLLIAERRGQILGTFQLTLVPGLSRRGSTRADIEAVRVSSDARGLGVGTTMMEHAIEVARSAGAVLVQLTSDVSRTEAHRFYERLGFKQTHYGFKLMLI
jgi:ribosomal protein S18 acetylase RimI-like enzyme